MPFFAGKVYIVSSAHVAILHSSPCAARAPRGAARRVVREHGEIDREKDGKEPRADRLETNSPAKADENRIMPQVEWV